MGYLVFLDVAAGVIDGIMLVWSIFIVQDLIKSKKIQKILFFRCLGAFSVLYLVTSFLRIAIGFPLGFSFNLVMLMHFLTCFFVFFGLFVEDDLDSLKKEFFTILQISVLALTFFQTLGFILLLFKKNITIFKLYSSFRSLSYSIGIAKNPTGDRFSGVFNNPNTLAFSSCVCLIFTHILVLSQKFFYAKKTFFSKFIAFSVCLVSLSSLILSDSLASFIFILSYLLCYIFYYLIIRNKLSLPKIIRKISVFFACAIILISLSIAIKLAFQNSFTDFLNDIHNPSAGQTKTVPESVLDSEKMVSFGRFGKIGYDVKDGSGRKLMIFQALTLFKHYPLFGIGISNIIDYGKLHFEDGISTANFHNGYLTILTCHGIFAFALFCFFFFGIFIKLFTFLIKRERNSKNDIYPCLFCALISYAVFALLEKSILSEINLISVFFWWILGFATLSMIKNKDISKFS